MFSINPNSNLKMTEREIYLLELLAHKILINSGQNTLPVNPYSIIKQGHIYSIGYEKLLEIEKCNIDDLTNKYGVYGSIIYTTKLHRYILFHNDCLDKQLDLWVLSCLLAYIELDLLIPDQAYYFEDEDDFGELAEEFTYILTAPDDILYSCNILSAKNIMNTCCLPHNIAIKKYHRLKKWRKRSYSDSPLLHKLRLSFQEYILHKQK